MLPSFCYSVLLTDLAQCCVCRNMLLHVFLLCQGVTGPDSKALLGITSELPSQSAEYQAVITAQFVKLNDRFTG